MGRCLWCSCTGPAPNRDRRCSAWLVEDDVERGEGGGAYRRSEGTARTPAVDCCSIEPAMEVGDKPHGVKKVVAKHWLSNTIHASVRTTPVPVLPAGPESRVQIEGARFAVGASCEHGSCRPFVPGSCGASQECLGMFKARRAPRGRVAREEGPSCRPQLWMTRRREPCAQVGCMMSFAHGHPGRDRPPAAHH